MLSQNSVAFKNCQALRLSGRRHLHATANRPDRRAQSINRIETSSGLGVYKAAVNGGTWSGCESDRRGCFIHVTIAR